jgi:hypothetical protein
LVQGYIGDESNVYAKRTPSIGENIQRWIDGIPKEKDFGSVVRTQPGGFVLMNDDPNMARGRFNQWMITAEHPETIRNFVINMSGNSPENSYDRAKDFVDGVNSFTDLQSTLEPETVQIPGGTYHNGVKYMKAWDGQNIKAGGDTAFWTKRQLYELNIKFGYEK